ncbi:hypothetical protein BGZ58_004230, partial [Dissophora ornata]
MAEDHLNLLCLVDGDTISRAFSVIASSGSTVDQLKDLIKAEQTVAFRDVNASELTLWRVTVPVIAAHKHENVILHSLDDKEGLLPTDELSDVFNEKLQKRTVHIIVQRPPP